MYPTLLDTQTGKLVKSKCPRKVEWWLTGNGSCDCLRYGLSGVQANAGPGKQCLGSKRFLVWDVHGDLEGWDKADLAEACNEYYPDDLMDKYFINWPELPK